MRLAIRLPVWSWALFAGLPGCAMRATDPGIQPLVYVPVVAMAAGAGAVVAFRIARRRKSDKKSKQQK